ncbi:NAD(P)-binding domain-containing protein [Nocardia sp. 2]|uniref:NAD(P)-binding domain-containing protein n=1 Tax=Nocardia acididurans TaxID=2802282 RepID=A0ABS1M995_9NOCA|nr:NAD(P)-binding domain-containing protein [Nocardia acididurans]MBL1075728.1 NAD(P)-binding domain-containing protein [Nocardia acididurans]
MRIAILGAGQMARALGAGWSAAGHDLAIGARNPQQANDTAAHIGGTAYATTIPEAAAFGEAVLLALPVPALSAVLRAAAPHLANRTLIDCTNAYSPDSFAPGSPGFTLTESAVAERIAATAPDAYVVKAFNLCAAEVWSSPTRDFDGRPLAVPLCGDDPAALDTVASLAEDLKLRPIRAGGLAQTRYLEATSAFIVGLWFSGHDARAAFPPLEAAFAVPDGD